jgi:hypothetical protein
MLFAIVPSTFFFNGNDWYNFIHAVMDFRNRDSPTFDTQIDFISVYGLQNVDKNITDTIFKASI